jgi:hypothetical protein
LGAAPGQSPTGRFVNRPYTPVPPPSGLPSGRCCALGPSPRPSGTAGAKTISDATLPAAPGGASLAPGNRRPVRCRRCDGHLTPGTPHPSRSRPRRSLAAREGRRPERKPAPRSDVGGSRGDRVHGGPPARSICRPSTSLRNRGKWVNNNFWRAVGSGPPGCGIPKVPHRTFGPTGATGAPGRAPVNPCRRQSAKSLPGSGAKAPERG